MKDLIKKKFNENPFLLKYAQDGLINIQAYAESLQHEISKFKNQPVSVNSIAMNIRRYLKQTTTLGAQDWEFPKDIEISSRTGIYEIAFPRKNLKKIYKIFSNYQSVNDGNFLSILEGSYEVVVLTNMANAENIKRLSKDFQVTSEVKNLGYITVNWENLTKEIPGIYAKITHAIAVNNISIQSFHTIGAEMMIIVRESQVNKLLDVISSMFSKTNS